jgi:hypothetical protein
MHVRRQGERAVEEAKEGQRSYGRYISKALYATLRMKTAILLDHLDCTFWALDFTCSAH